MSEKLTGTFFLITALALYAIAYIALGQCSADDNGWPRVVAALGFPGSFWFAFQAFGALLGFRSEV